MGGEQHEPVLYSSFKQSAVRSSSRTNKSAFGGSVGRFREVTANGHYLSAKENASQDAEEESICRTKDLPPAYSSFARSSVKQRKSAAYMGGTTSRFHTNKRNGGLVTPGPGAFEVQASSRNAKGFFGNVEPTLCRPISMLA